MITNGVLINPDLTLLVKSPDRAQVSWQEDSRLGPPISEGDDGLLYGCKQRAWKAPSTRTRDSRQKSGNSGVAGEISDGRE